MSYIHASVSGIGSLINLGTLIGLFAGIVWGMLISFMPGVGGNVALALLLPFMYKLSIAPALALLLGTHIATYFGGSITSITLNIPASAKSMPLCWDGYPLARRGRGAYALGASASAAGIGGVIGAIALTLGIPIMRSLLNYLGPPEVLLLAVLGAILIAILSSGNLTKGLIAFGVGILLASVGQDPITGVDRLTFGSLYLSNGIQVADVAIGLFALVQVMRLMSERMKAVAPQRAERVARGVKMSLRERLAGEATPIHGLGAVLRHWKLEVYMALFGVLTGTVPGFGAPVAAVAAYGQAAQFSGDDDEFGDGAIAGVIAPEATESAAEGGGMLPLLSLGIPTHEQQALLLAAFVTLGIAPGPTMLTQHLPTVFSIIWLIVGASLAVMLMGLVLARQFAKLTIIPTHTLVPLVLSIAVVGSFAVNGRIGDVITTAVVGILGYFFWKYNYSRINLIIGLVLGPIIESNLHISTTLYGDAFMFKRPLSAGITVVIVGALAGWGYRVWRDRRLAVATAAENPVSVQPRPQAGERVRANLAKPGRLIAATALLATFIAVALIASTYSALTGGDVVLVASLGAALAAVNLGRLLFGEGGEEIGIGERLRKAKKPSDPKGVPAPARAFAGAPAPAPAGVPAPEPALALATGDLLTRVGVAEPITPPAAGEEADAVPAGARESVHPEAAGLLRAMATVAGYLLLVLLGGVVPGVAFGFGLYALIVRRKPWWYALALVVGVGLIVWLVFHFVVNAYAPYQGYLHFIPT